jgi:hypothetical protein
MTKTKTLELSELELSVLDAGLEFIASGDIADWGMSCEELSTLFDKLQFD